MDEYSLSPSYATLPMELILHILDYLGFSDLQCAGTTCTKWRTASLDNKFNRSAMAHFVKVSLADESYPVQSVLSSERPIQNIYFEDVTFGNVELFFKYLSNTVISIDLEETDIIQKQFWYLIKRLKKLKYLTINNCPQLFMLSTYNGEDYEQCKEILSNVTSLSFPNNQYLTDAQLQRFTIYIKELRSLNLAGCYIAFHNSIQNRFYPNKTIEKPSDSILTYLFIIKLINIHVQCIIDINLSDTAVTVASLEALTKLESGRLQLNKLTLTNCKELNCNISIFLKYQQNLVSLDLSNTSCVDDNCIYTLLEHNSFIEELNIKNSKLITNNGAVSLKKLRNLRCLNISGCINVTTEGIVDGIASENNGTLKQLDMSNLNIYPDAIKAVALNLKELTVLNLNYCINGLNDVSIQIVLEHLIKLHELYLEGCVNITDSGLTGIYVTQQILNEETFNSSATLRISLRSKAEEDIVQDANRKKVLLKACEMSLQESAFIKGFNIQRLKSLNVLNINNCNKITDMSLKYGIRFTELRLLLLSKCQQISFIGMESLTFNAASIEVLDLTDCYYIDDKTIITITTKLKRLKALHISGCIQLTEHSLDAIIKNCNCLQTWQQRRSSLHV